MKKYTNEQIISYRKISLASLLTTLTFAISYYVSHTNDFDPKIKAMLAMWVVSTLSSALAIAFRLSKSLKVKDSEMRTLKVEKIKRSIETDIVIPFLLVFMMIVFVPPEIGGTSELWYLYSGMILSISTVFYKIKNSAIFK